MKDVIVAGRLVQLASPSRIIDLPADAGTMETLTVGREAPTVVPAALDAAE